MSLSMFILDSFPIFCHELNILKKYFLPCFDKTGVVINNRKFKEVIERYSQIYYRYFSKGF